MDDNLFADAVAVAASNLQPRIISLGEAKAMDVLLGRKRTGNPVKGAANGMEQFQQAGDIQTEEQAAAALGIRTPIQEEAAAKAAQAMVASTEGTMPPPPPPSDGSAVYSAFRKFTG